MVLVSVELALTREDNFNPIGVFKVKQGAQQESKKSRLEEQSEMDGASHETHAPQRKVSDKRSRCKASIQVRLHEGGIWGITAFHQDHNHELVKSTPS